MPTTKLWAPTPAWRRATRSVGRSAAGSPQQHTRPSSAALSLEYLGGGLSVVRIRAASAEAVAPSEPDPSSLVSASVFRDANVLRTFCGAFALAQTVPMRSSPIGPCIAPD